MPSVGLVRRSRTGCLPPGLLAEPALEDLAALMLTQAGQLPVDLRRDPGAASAPEVDHVAAVIAIAAGVQTDAVVAPHVRAGRSLHQASPGDPTERAVDQGLATSLLEAVGEPVGQQPRRGLRLHQ